MAGYTNGLNGEGGSVLFTNVRILDATGEQPYSGDVLVQGNRIKQITRGSSRFSQPMTSSGATVIDGMGATLMPGMIDAHLHLSWNNAPGIDPIQMMELEEHMLVTMEMAKLVLDAGFTAGRGAAAAKPRLDVVAKRFINEGRFLDRAISLPVRRSPRSAAWAMPLRPTFRTKGSISGWSSRDRRKCGGSSAH